MPIRRLAALPLLCAIPLCAVSCGDYKYDTVSFQLTSPAVTSGGPVPGTFINTNTSITGPFGGSVKTKKPYSIGIDHSDLTFTVAAIEFTKVTVTYRDGTEDPGAAALKLPVRFESRPHEAVNSTSRGIVKTKMRLVSGMIPGVITRDKPLTLLLEGRFIHDNGSTTPFTIREEYDVSTDKSTKPWAEVVSDI